MSDGPKDEDGVATALAFLLRSSSRHEIMIRGCGSLLEALGIMIIDAQPKCDECHARARWKCGGRTKRHLCDRHLAIELKPFTCSKELFEGARSAWHEVPNVRAADAVEDYLTSLVDSSPLSSQVH